MTFGLKRVKYGEWPHHVCLTYGDRCLFSTLDSSYCVTTFINISSEETNLSSMKMYLSKFWSGPLRSVPFQVHPLCPRKLLPSNNRNITPAGAQLSTEHIQVATKLEVML